MKLFDGILALGIFQAVAGHTVFTTLFVNDINQGDGTCIRMPKNAETATNPINNLAGEEMSCGFDGTKGVPRICSVKQSSTLSFLFQAYPDGSQAGVIDDSHKGPCAVYMKYVTSAINDTAVGDGWFKIWDEGYEFSTGQWCTEKLIQNNGLLTTTIPADLAAGYYLVRPEILTLHESDKRPPNPQFYVGCAQIFLESAATAGVQRTFSIPGYISIHDPAVLFNIYKPKWPAPRVGPAPYVSGSGSYEITTAKKSQEEGLALKNAVLTNANWAAVEVDSYSTEDGCWTGSSNCFKQLGVCYETAPPTGSAGCRIWEDHCMAIQKGCNNGKFNGPPALNTPALVATRMLHKSRSVQPLRHKHQRPHWRY